MRVARKATDNLQEEYCRIVHSVATEKQRNLMYIEKAKREFITELIQVNIKMAEVENIQKKLSLLEKRLQDKEHQINLSVDMKIQEQESRDKLRQKEIKDEVAKCHELVKTMQHQQDMVIKDHSRIEMEVQNTDFFLNKVQPISIFSTMVTLMRNVTDDEDQLNRISEIQDQFFAQINSESALPDLEKTLKMKREQSILDKEQAD